MAFINIILFSFFYGHYLGKPPHLLNASLHCLPPACAVRGKVMFWVVSVLLFTGGPYPVIPWLNCTGSPELPTLAWGTNQECQPPPPGKTRQGQEEKSQFRNEPLTVRSTVNIYQTDSRITRHPIHIFQFNFTAILIVCLLVSPLYRYLFNPRTTSATIRHTIALGGGLAILYFAFGRWFFFTA